MKKVISILLAICILIIPSGCRSNKDLTMQKASRKVHYNFLVLHTPENVYDLYNYKYKRGILVGQLRKSSYHKKKTIHVYTNQKLNIEPSLDSYQKVYIEKSDIALTSRRKLQERKIVQKAGIISVIFITAFLFPGKPGTSFLDKRSM